MQEQITRAAAAAPVGPVQRFWVQPWPVRLEPPQPNPAPAWHPPMLRFDQHDFTDVQEKALHQAFESRAREEEEREDRLSKTSRRPSQGETLYSEFQNKDSHFLAGLNDGSQLEQEKKEANGTKQEDDYTGLLKQETNNRLQEIAKHSPVISRPCQTIYHVDIIGKWPLK